MTKTIKDSLGPDDGVDEIEIPIKTYKKILEWVNSYETSPTIEDDQFHISDGTTIDGYQISSEYFKDGYSVAIKNDEGIVIVPGGEL